ncbi:MAG: hypothetical protein QXO69_02150 [archaeon]
MPRITPEIRGRMLARKKQVIDNYLKKVGYEKGKERELFEKVTGKKAAGKVKLEKNEGGLVFVVKEKDFKAAGGGIFYKVGGKTHELPASGFIPHAGVPGLGKGKVAFALAGSSNPWIEYTKMHEGQHLKDWHLIKNENAHWKKTVKKAKEGKASVNDIAQIIRRDMKDELRAYVNSSLISMHEKAQKSPVHRFVSFIDLGEEIKLINEHLSSNSMRISAKFSSIGPLQAKKVEINKKREEILKDLRALLFKMENTIRKEKNPEKLKKILNNAIERF